MIAREVIGFQEEADAAAGLGADGGLLRRTIGPGQQEARLAPGGATSTQRFASDRGMSSISSKPRAPT